MSLMTPQNDPAFLARRALEALPDEERRRRQLERLRRLISRILPENRFYQAKLGNAPRLDDWDDLRNWPFTTKSELVDGDGPFAANRTHDLDRYVRFHRTSGTTGRPMAVVDTAEDWQWWIDGWQFVLDAADVDQSDRAVMAFSYGPFVGFWSAHDAVAARGALAAPGGGMSTLARLELIQSLDATLVLCTPSYALHMADTADSHGIDLRATEVSRIIVAGEPGGSLEGVRRRIESAWDARVVDHSGATEIGPWGYGDREGAGLFVNERDFLAEFLDPRTGDPAGDGELAELVLTTLGRSGSPVIRYRTGDLVRATRRKENRFAFLEGGVLGRGDDMMIVRGVNVFPSSIENILREFDDIVEFRLTAFKEGAMDALRLEVEDRSHNPGRIAEALQVRLGLNVRVEEAPEGALPRFEAKGQRFVDQR